MAKEKVIKTNAIRILQSKKIAHDIIIYDVEDGKIDGVSVSEKTGQNPKEVFKTLVLQGHSKEYYVCMIPVAMHLDLKKAASAFGEKNIEMIPSRDLLKLTGYVHGGCSPIGMKKEFKKAIDESARNLEYICVSGGKIGVQMRLKVDDLMEISKSEFHELTQD